jgi:hypothetical protein
VGLYHYYGGMCIFKTGIFEKLFLTPIILAIQEAEIRRIMVQSQPPANSFHPPTKKKKKKNQPIRK